MKVFFYFLMALAASPLGSIQIDEITDSFLCSTPYSDHVQHFEKLFNEVQIDSFLEFGLGYGTKYFLEKCRRVTSCEILLPGQGEEWLRETQGLFQGYAHWNPILIQGSEDLGKANLLSAIERKDPALYDATYLLEMKRICNEIFKRDQFEMVFVDPGFHMRGDLVNELFDRVPIIAAHNTSSDAEVYGWHKINIPSNYEKIVFSRGQGLTFWIRKDQPELICALKRYFPVPERDLKKRNLRIFFPQMHAVLVQSMALALQHLGHTLLLPGESFDPNSPHPGLKIDYGTFFKKNPLESLSFTSFFTDSPEDCTFLKNNVEVIENDELIKHPPDILFVNCEQVEKCMYKIWRHCKKSKKPMKLAHYSGNNSSHYERKKVKNLIAVDAYTASQFNPAETNIIFWIPWIDFENLPFNGINDSLVLNSYISHYDKSLKKGAAVYKDLEMKMKTDFPMVEINSYPKEGHFPHNSLSSLLEESCATLHIKETEGFGYTIIESLAKGRPVFLKRSFSLGSRLMNWCIEGRTAFFFDEYEEFHQKLSKYLEDAEFRHRTQKDCAQTIRQIIDNEKQARILEHFLYHLK